MPAAEPNKAVRLIVPLVVGVFGVLIAVGVFTGSKPTPAPSAQTAPVENDPAAAEGDTPPEAATPQPATSEPATTAPDRDETATPSAGPATGPIENASAGDDLEPAESLLATDLRVRTQPVQEDLATLGAANPDGQYPLLLEFSQEGAGVSAITLADYAQTLGSSERYAIQRETTLQAGQYEFSVAALAARAVRVNGKAIDLFGAADAPVWRQTAPGAFEAVIETAAGEPVLRLVKNFVITPETYDIRVNQRIENLSAAPVEYQWIQYGPVDLPEGESTYLRDPRRVWFGHLLPTESDPSRQFVRRTDIRSRQKVIDKPVSPDGLIWPPPTTEPGAEELVYAALTNRYFAFAVHPVVEDAQSGQPLDKHLRAADRVYRTILQGVPSSGVGLETHVVLELHSENTTLSAGETHDLSLAAYAGPLSRRILASDSLYETLGLDALIVYNIGGPCAFCPFQPLARGLLWFLGVFHDYIVFDWALAIMVLVVFVRGALHPITKKSQIRMQRFSKQMQGIAPKQKKLQEKYKDDPKRLQQEMARLMREEGVDFTGALGCLPMFLQTPVWIALYAMLYYAFDLRHEPAYFGLFQQISGGSWGFLADLSAPDRFLDFGAPIVTLPMLGAITSLNILPLLLGVVFYMQQKYLTPPTSATLTPEQQTQQKIVKVMMVVMFPVFMYQAPSGLSIYFITNSTLGIFESRYIRAHIDSLPEPEPKKRKVKPAPGAAQQRPRKRVLNENASGFKDRKKKR